MCHLWSDTLPELLDMVDRINVQRKWIQGHPELSFGKHRDASWVHFDISLEKKRLALENGAILTDRYGPVLHTKRLALMRALQTGDHETIARLSKFIQDVEEMRQARE